MTTKPEGPKKPIRSEAWRPTATGEVLFKAAVREQSALKAGLFGGQGVGKSTTAMLIAIALSKLYHKSAPIFMHDTENGSDFLEPIAKLEGVPFFVRKSRSFGDMCAGLREAEKAGACCYIEDSTSTDWAALLESFRNSFTPPLRRIELYHWGQIKPVWNQEWVVPMLNSPLHVIACGRVGMVIEQIQQADGSTQAEPVGTKFKAEGEFGYEPNLLLEMDMDRHPDSGQRKSRGTLTHRATVLKDRTRLIQGAVFHWPDINEYNPGDFAKVFEKIKPHVDFLNIGGTQKAVEPAAAEALFDTRGNGEYHRQKQQAQIFLEEIEGTLVQLWPGQDVKAKSIKQNVVERLFGTRSWTKVTTLSTSDLEIGLVRLKNFEFRFDHNALADQEAVLRALNELILHPVPERKRNDAAASEAALAESLEQPQGDEQPQVPLS